MKTLGEWLVTWKPDPHIEEIVSGFNSPNAFIDEILKVPVDDWQRKYLLGDFSKGALMEKSYNPLPVMLDGIQFKSAKDKSRMISRIINEFTATRDAIRGTMTATFEENRKTAAARHDEETKALRSEISRLTDALELMQRRHLSDITNWAKGEQREDCASYGSDIAKRMFGKVE